MSTLRPIGNTVLFTFLDETQGAQGAFSERTRTGLIIPRLQSTQRGERWARVTAVGPTAVEDGVNIGDFILIEPLMWTANQSFEGAKVWKTTTEKILIVTNDESATIPY